MVGMVVALSRAFVIESGTAFDPEAAMLGERAARESTPAQERTPAQKPTPDQKRTPAEKSTPPQKEHATPEQQRLSLAVCGCSRVVELPLKGLPCAQYRMSGTNGRPWRQCPTRSC